MDQVEMLKKAVDHFSAKCERQRCEIVELKRELEAAKKVADAAMTAETAEMVCHAFDRVVEKDVIWTDLGGLLSSAWRAVRAELEDAIREYRKLKEAA